MSAEVLVRFVQYVMAIVKTQVPRASEGQGEFRRELYVIL